MYRGTTPKIKINVKTDLDLNTMSQIWVTISSKLEQITVEKDDLTILADEKLIYAELSQEDTLKFQVGEVRIQVRMLDNNGNAYASSIFIFQMNEILKDGVIE